MIKAVNVWDHFDGGLLLWLGRERCGFVVKDDDSSSGYAFLELPNVATDPVAFFEMDGTLTREVFSRFNVLGLWHSHPPGRPQPSETDREWHPRHLDMYIITDLRIHRYVHVDALTYQEVPTPWTV